MKKAFIYMLTAACAALLALSCEPTNTDDEGNEGENTETLTLKPGTYKFTASSMKGTWKEGDKIYVRGGTGASSETVTLKASDISADGKTASAQLNGVTADVLEPDGLYAAWPDDALQHSYGVLSLRTTFIQCDGLLTVAYLKGDTFAFTDASSAIDFTVTGGYDSYAIAANSREGIIVTKLDVEYTSAKTKITPKQTDGYPFKYGNVVSGTKNRVVFPGEVTFNGGYTIYLRKNGAWSAIISTTKDVTLTPGKPLDLGDITSSLTAYNGPEPRIPQMGKFTKYTVKSFAELSGLCLSENEDFLWAVGDEGDLGKISFTGEVLYTFHIGGDAEDISRNPESGDLLIGLEPKGVGVVKGPDFNTKVTTLFNIDACKDYGNSGIEGLTYYKDGKVLVGSQANSHLFLCDLSGKKVIWDKKLWSKELISEIGGLCYDPLTDWLWIIDSEAKKIFVVTVDESNGNISLIGAYSVRDVANPESVCVDHKHSCVWVGDDLGDNDSYLFKYEFTGLDDFNK